MIEAMLAGFLLLSNLKVLFAVVAGVVVGLVFGLIPGIGVMPIMAIAIPLTFDMEPIIALSLLIAIHAVGVTGGSITAILLGIPGTAVNAATLIDGFEMTKKGQGGRACGAALSASALGGVFGSIVLAFMMPVAYFIIMAFGSAESFLVVLLGLTLIVVVSRGSTIQGLLSAAVGLMLGFVGMHEISGWSRFTFGNLYLYEGIPLIPFILGMFALPEVFDLTLKRGGTLAEVDSTVFKNTSRGVIPGYLCLQGNPII